MQEETDAIRRIVGERVSGNLLVCSATTYSMVLDQEIFFECESRYNYRQSKLFLQRYCLFNNVYIYKI